MNSSSNQSNFVFISGDMHVLSGIIKQLLQARPQLAYHRSEDGQTPLALAVVNNNIECVKIFLENYSNLAYILDKHTGHTPFLLAAEKGFVPIAKVIISFCLESAYITNDSENALHVAIRHHRQDFVDFILKTPQLHRLINQADDYGDLPLHHAARRCNPNILRSLLSHKRQDCTALNYKNFNAVDIVCNEDMFLKTLQWNEVFALVSHAIPSTWWHVTGDEAKKKGPKYEAAKEALQKQTSNTSVVAALLATITFAAAFTLPGGFSSDPSNIGLPTFARKAVFQAFLISDTIAMCSSLAVAFLSILTPWYWDFEFLVNYRKTTLPLMWCAYTATAMAFGTGLFTVMAPKSLWLAILILVLSCILPFLSKIIGDWPKIILHSKLWRYYWSDLIAIISRYIKICGWC